MAIIYVNRSLTTGNNNGDSWTNAFRGPDALQNALDNTSAINNQIWVSQGVYKPSISWDVVTGAISAIPREKSFNIPSDIKIFGGFSGDEQTLNERNINNNPTILSGDIGTVGDPLDNSYHVVLFRRVSEETLLDGFTIMDGFANGTGVHSQGGGVYNFGETTASKPYLRNCNFFRNNSAAGGGAGVYNDGTNGDSSAAFENCVFEENITDLANGLGGAVLNNGESGLSSPIFLNCVFSNNSGHLGGAVYNFGHGGGICTPSFVNCLFYSNEATLVGGAIYNTGSGGVCTPTFFNNTFYNNNAVTSGTTFYNNFSAPIVTNSIIWNDFTPAISLIENVSSTFTISYSDIKGGYIGTNNIDSDPLFINENNAIGPDGIWRTNDDGLALQECSPCVQTGTSVGAPFEDIIGNIRPDPPSMGAYEIPVFTAEPASIRVDCENNFGSLNVNGINNESIIWQISADGINWRNTETTSSILNFSNLQEDTFYRVRIVTDACPTPLFSSISQISVRRCTTTPAPTTPAPIPKPSTSVTSKEQILSTYVFDWVTLSAEHGISIII